MSPLSWGFTPWFTKPEQPRNHCEHDKQIQHDGYKEEYRPPLGRDGKVRGKKRCQKERYEDAARLYPDCEGHGEKSRSEHEFGKDQLTRYCVLYDGQEQPKQDEVSEEHAREGERFAQRTGFRCQGDWCLGFPSLSKRIRCWGLHDVV